MKPIEEVDIKELKKVVKELNDSGLLTDKLKIVGVNNKDLVANFAKAIEDITEPDPDLDIPQGIANFYNDLIADEIIAEGGELPEDETPEPEILEDETPEPEIPASAPAKTKSKPAPAAKAPAPAAKKPESAPVVKDKPAAAKKTAPVVRDKPAPAKKPSLGVEKRATINPKLSLVKKVTNILNFKDGRYKQTTYFPLDCETIRILETNSGLYPSEIMAAMLQDKKIAKKVEPFSPGIMSREINKIKTAYSYIVGAIREDKADSKFRNIMMSLLTGKDIPADMAHPSTVKVARRALLAYLDVTGVDYSVMKTVKQDLVKKASEKAPEAKVAPAPAPAKKTPAPAPKPAAKAPAPAAKKPEPKAPVTPAKKTPAPVDRSKTPAPAPAPAAKKAPAKKPASK